MKKDYIRYEIEVTEQEQNDILIAMLSEWGVEGFEEQETTLFASGPEDEMATEEIETYLTDNSIAFSKSTVKQENWNAVWESNFHPIQVDDFVGIRADFHEPFTGVEHEIVITPKMSFGTGHHATTFMMMQLMRDTPLAGKKVFDFGSGTGILAILAEKLGATDVLAGDYDEWCIENSTENIERNNCSAIKIQQLDRPPAEETYDVVLANINKHILLANMEQMASSVLPGGLLLMSGLLVQDESDIKQAAENVGFQYHKTLEKNGWIALLFEKIK